MSINRYSNNHLITVGVGLAWMIIGGLVIMWQVMEIQKKPAPIVSDAKGPALINADQIQQALSYLDEDQLTSNAPSDTLNLEPASPSSELVEEPPLN